MHVPTQPYKENVNLQHFVSVQNVFVFLLTSFQGLKDFFAQFLLYLLPNCSFFKHVITWRQMRFMKQSMTLKHHQLVRLLTVFIDSLAGSCLLEQYCMNALWRWQSQWRLIQDRRQSKRNYYKSICKSCITQKYMLILIPSMHWYQNSISISL